MVTDTTRAPRVASASTSMARAAAAVANRYADESFEGGALRIFDRVPVRHGVLAVAHDSAIVRRGEVVVYDESDSDELVDGGLYVIEYQAPRAGLPKHMWADSPGFRMVATRHLVVLRLRRNEHWWADPMRTRRPGQFICSDGPYDPIYLREKLIGRVVGVYNPAAFATVSQ